MIDELLELPIECLRRGQFQPRAAFCSVALQELADSIKARGIIEPIIVRPLNDSSYEIIAGERRWRAAQLADLSTVPCVVRHYSDAQAAEVSLIENIQRENLNPIEEAQALARLLQEFNYTHEAIAKAVGKSRASVSNSLRLLKLDQRVQQYLIDKKLTEGHGKALAALPFEQQYALAKTCCQKVWSVRQLEKAIFPIKSATAISTIDADVRRLERIASEHFNTEVSLENAAEGGWVKVKYYDYDTLQGILDKMQIKVD